MAGYVSHRVMQFSAPITYAAMLLNNFGTPATW